MLYSQDVVVQYPLFLIVCWLLIVHIQANWKQCVLLSVDHTLLYPLYDLNQAAHLQVLSSVCLRISFSYPTSVQRLQNTLTAHSGIQMQHTRSSHALPCHRHANLNFLRSKKPIDKAFVTLLHYVVSSPSFWPLSDAQARKHLSLRSPVVHEDRQYKITRFYLREKNFSPFFFAFNLKYHRIQKNPHQKAT